MIWSACGDASSSQPAAIDDHGLSGHEVASR
jgi:hypothetical protein